MPSQPQFANSWKIGVRMATPGNIDEARIAARTKPLPRNASRASAYPAKTPITMASSVTHVLMIRLLTSDRPNLLLVVLNA